MDETRQKLEAARGILFDLDNTLYPREKGVFKLINEKINDYVEFATGRKGPEVDTLREEYKERYGTTLGGLMRHDEVDVEEYLAFVHNVPVEDLLEPDPGLTALLSSIGLPKVIFTNGTRAHAGRVLDALGVTPFFEGICDLASTAYLGKPHPEAFNAAADLLGCGFSHSIFVDDLAVNVAAGRALGMLSVHVNGRGGGAGDIQVACVRDLEDVFSAMPWYGKKVSGV